MPLTFCRSNELVKVTRVSGSPEVKKHLEDLGFALDSMLRVISIQNGNVIVNVKDSRIAIGQSIANKIQVEVVKVA